jgi:hypothetical protein
VQVEPQVEPLAHAHDPVEEPPFTVTLEDEILRKRHERYREHGSILESIDQQLELEDAEVPNRDLGSLVQRLFTGSRIDYTVLDPSKPLDYALFRYLSSREKLSRVR